jgi:hypothetical protein
MTSVLLTTQEERNVTIAGHIFYKYVLCDFAYISELDVHLLQIQTFSIEPTEPTLNIHNV